MCEVVCVCVCVCALREVVCEGLTSQHSLTSVFFCLHLQERCGRLQLLRGRRWVLQLRVVAVRPGRVEYARRGIVLWLVVGKKNNQLLIPYFDLWCCPF